MFPDIPGLSLIPRFIAPEEELRILLAADKGRWTIEGSKRAQKYWDGSALPLRDPSTERLSRGLPDFSAGVTEALSRAWPGASRPYRLILSDYQPGDGMALHVDHVQPFRNRVAILSLGSAYTMEFRNAFDGRRRALLLPACSLLMLEGEARYEWAHGIEPRHDERGVARGRRVSLAFSCAEAGEPAASTPRPPAEGFGSRERESP